LSTINTIPAAGIRSSVSPRTDGAMQVVRIRKKRPEELAGLPEKRDDTPRVSARDQRWEERRRKFYQRGKSVAISPVTPSVPGDPSGLWRLKRPDGANVRYAGIEKGGDGMGG